MMHYWWWDLSKMISRQLKYLKISPAFMMNSLNFIVLYLDFSIVYLSNKLFIKN